MPEKLPKMRNTQAQYSVKYLGHREPHDVQIFCRSTVAIQNGSSNAIIDQLFAVAKLKFFALDRGVGV